jgi:hypothetical protein
VKELDDRVHLLEGQISEVEDENKHLKERLESTNTSVGSFIKDMSSLLDQHELTSIMHMDEGSEEEERGHIEFEEIRPHAGTGGSSKLRSRPGQQVVMRPPPQ